MRVLLITSNWTETLGHIVRSAAAAQQLIDEGHEVALLGFPSYREYIPPQVKFFACEPLPPDYEPSVYFGHHTYEDVVYASGGADEAHIVRTIERERDVIRQYRPDLIFNDEQFTIGLSAAIERVPVMSLVTWPLHPAFNQRMETEIPARSAILRRLRNSWNRVLRRYELPPIQHLSELLFKAGNVLIAPTSPQLEPELQHHEPNVHYVGPMEPAGLFDEEPDWLHAGTDGELPLVYIYLSSLSVGVNSASTFEKLYECFSGQPYRVVFALGKFNSLPLPMPRISEDGRIRFETFVPGRAVMRAASLAVYPATHSMMMAAIRNQVPSLLLPDLFERVYNAACLTAVGIGKTVSVEDVSVTELRSLCEAMLAMKRNPSDLQAAAYVQADMESLGGTARVVQLMQQMKQTGESI